MRCSFFFFFFFTFPLLGDGINLAALLKILRAAAAAAHITSMNAIAQIGIGALFVQLQSLAIGKGEKEREWDNEYNKQPDSRTNKFDYRQIKKW